MKRLLCTLLACALTAAAHAAPVPLFDGKTFEGWEGDTQKTWRIQDGAIVGGSLTEKVPRNEFLATKKSYKNFDLRLKFKLAGTEGFVNSGVQFRSVRIPNPPNEMKGYQADLGDPSWWGCIYDESRRNKVMAQSDMKKIELVLKRQDWNDYRVRAVGPRIQVWINGVMTVDYTEEDPAIPQDGSIAVQVHGGGKAEVSFKDIMIEELPADAAPQASNTKAPAKAGVAVGGRDISYNAADARPLTAEEERASFRLPEGFVAELVADESVMPKAVAFNFDHAGRMWVTTASEYPLDANEQPEAAAKLYREGGKDAVLIFDTPWAKGLQKPRVWAGQIDTGKGIPDTGKKADGDADAQSAIRNPQSAIKLAMPMGVLPYKDGAIVQHGQDLLFLRDTDNDGVADKKEVLLTGFGIQDSHLMPHGFTRGPGDWIYFAQGAFNTSVVKTKEGTEVTAKHCKLMRMKPDGSKFEVVGWGLNNIWGFVIDPRGEMWVQEANDMGYPLAPFQPYMAYPGIGSDKPAPYAPFMPPPKKLNDCTMGGTGLSGLALNEDPGTWPAPWTGAFMVANPITNKIQAIRVHRTSEGEGRVSPRAGEGAANQKDNDKTSPSPTREDTRPTSYDDVALEKLPDFLVSEDKSFRPVAIQFGPDGSLYIIDWYNKIISHNEVPRSHPDRDKTRTRIWRIGAASREPADAFPNFSVDPQRVSAGGRQVPDLTQLSINQLVDRLSSGNPWEVGAARAEIIDRPRHPQHLTLGGKVRDTKVPFQIRYNCLWAIAARKEFTNVTAQLGREDPLWIELATAAAEMATAVVASGGTLDPWYQLSSPASELTKAQRHRMALCIDQISRGTRPRAGVSLFFAFSFPIIGESAHDNFDRYLMRGVFERHQSLYKEHLTTNLEFPLVGAALWTSVTPPQKAPLENLLLACLALPETEGAPILAKLIAKVSRPLKPEEVGLLARQIKTPEVSKAFTTLLANTAQQEAALESLAALPPVDDQQLKGLITTSAKSLADRDSGDQARRLVLRVAKAHRFAALEPYVIPFAAEGRAPADRLEAIKTLREIGSNDVELFARLARSAGSKEAEEIRRESVNALASASSDKVVPLVADLWPSLPAALRKLALDKLTSSKAQAQILVKLVRDGGGIALDQLDDVSIDKLVSVLGADHPDLSALLGEIKGAMQPVLRLTGEKGDMVETRLDLIGPFTVEAWVRMDKGISNEDVLLGSPEGPNFNFFDGRLRVYAGAAVHDALIAKTPMKPAMWTHVAITRNGDGQFKIFLNGELNADGGKAWKEPFRAMDIGRSGLPRGTGMSLTELRVWDSERNADQIRAAYQQSFAGEPVPAGVKFALMASAEQGMAFVPSAPKMAGRARVTRTRDFPELLTAAAARALEAKFAQYRALASEPGKAEHGRALFAATCAACHRVKGEGGQIGPDLSGAGAMGNEALLRNILTPNAQLESGYYRYDVELKSGDLLTGFLVKEDDNAVTVRPIGADDRAIPRSEIKSTKVTRKSLMPEGLLNGMQPGDVRDLFAYLNTLK